jgi:hypothetical protein
MSPIDVFLETKALRSALRSVVPHADRTRTGGDGAGTLHRVRFLFWDDTLALVATNTATSAAALVPLLDADGSPADPLTRADGDGNIPAYPQIVDLDPPQCRKLQAQFPVNRAEKDGQPQLLHWTSDDSGIDIEDVSGLGIPGDGARFRYTGRGEGFPDVWGIIDSARKVAAQSAIHGKPLVVPGPMISKFSLAYSAYGVSLSFTPVGGTKDSKMWLVEGGPMFLGLVESTYSGDDDSGNGRDDARKSWDSLFKRTIKTTKNVRGKAA